MTERSVNEILDELGAMEVVEVRRVYAAAREARKVLKEVNEYREIAVIDKLLKKWNKR